MLRLCGFGLIILTLAHALYLPVTKFPETTTPGGGDNPYGFTCPEGWTMHSTQCLLFVPQNLTWEEARKNCHAKGQQSLASVFTYMQTWEIYTEMKNAGHLDGRVWVGGSRATANSTWSWEENIVSFGISEFCSRGSTHHENNCLQLILDGSSSGCLDALQCDRKLPSVCGKILY